MTRITSLSALHLLLLAFAFSLGFHAEPAGAQTTTPTAPTAPTPLGCQSDPRFVRVLGVWQGPSVCEFTGHGTGEVDGMPGTSARCQGQVVTFGLYPYCVWYHGGNWLLASIIYDRGTQPMPPDDIMFPTPVGPTEDLTLWNHCTHDPRLVRTLGLWRGVTVCQMSGSGIGDPLPDSGCAPGGTYPNGRVRVFPDDFVNPPAPSSTPSPANPAGTRYCVTTAAFWEDRGVRAVIMARQPSHFDLGIDTHLVRQLPPAGSPSTLTIRIGSTQPIPAGAELVVRGSLTPAHYFGPMMPAALGWSCMGSWSAFSCHQVLSAPLTGSQIFGLPASYLPGLSGQNVTYSASVTMTNNLDPNGANNIMTTNTTLY